MESDGNTIMNVFVCLFFYARASGNIQYIYSHLRLPNYEIQLLRSHNVIHVTVFQI